MYNWNGRSNKEREVLFIQVLLGRDTSTSSLAQYGEFIPVEGSTEPDDKLLYYKDVVESIEITSTLQNNPDISDTEVINFTLDDSGYKVSEIKEEYGVSPDNSSYSSVATWVENPTIQPLTLNTTNRYLWNKTTITLSNGSSDSSYKIISSFLADTGSISVSELIEYYAISPYNTYAPELIFGTEVGKWNTEKPIGFSIDNRYIWNYNIVKFSDLSSQGGYNNSMIIGDYGNQVREVKFVDFSETGSPYSISGGIITANEDWWNTIGAFGKIFEWNYVADVTQIQINDVIVIRGIARVTNNGVTVNCDTLINSKVTQIQPIPATNPTYYKIKAITLNYVLEDVAIAQAELLGTRIFLVPSQDTYYLDNNNLILNPSDGKITVSLDYPETLTSTIQVGSWSTSDGFGAWTPILFNGITVPTSIEVILSNFITYDFFQVKCNNIIYRDGDLEIQINELITTIHREVTSSKLELICDNLIYKINPRYGDNYQIKNVSLISIGFELPDSYEWVANANSEISGSGELKIEDESHESCTLKIPYNLSPSANLVTLSYISPDFDLNGLRIKKSEISINSSVATFTRQVSQGLSGFNNLNVGDPITLYWSENIIEIQYITGVISSITSPLSSDDNYILVANISNSGILSRIRISQSEINVNSDLNTAIFTRTNFPGFVGISNNDPIILYWMEHDVIGGFVSGIVYSISTVDNTYTLVINNINVGEVTIANLDFNGIYEEPVAMYFGSHVGTNGILTIENLHNDSEEFESLSGFITGDSYYEKSTQSPMYYDAQSGWISYDNLGDGTTLKSKLLSDCLYDAIRNKSNALGNDSNIGFFKGLASVDGFIENLMAQYLKVGGVLYSGTKKFNTRTPGVTTPTEDNTIFDINGVITDANSNRIIALTYGSTIYITEDTSYSTRQSPNPSIVYLLDDGVNKSYYRFYEEIYDELAGTTYRGFIRTDNTPESIKFLSKYDFNPSTNSIRDGIHVSDGFYVNSLGNFTLGNDFQLKGEIFSKSLKTSNDDDPAGTYSSSINGKAAVYLYEEILSSIYSVVDKDKSVQGSISNKWSGSFNGSSIVDVDYRTSSVTSVNFISGLFEARGLSSRDSSYTVRYDGTLSWSYEAPYLYHYIGGAEDRTTINIDVTHNNSTTRVSSSSYSDSDTYHVYRGDTVQVTWNSISDQWFATCSYNRYITISYYPSGTYSGLTFIYSDGSYRNITSLSGDNSASDVVRNGNANITLDYYGSTYVNVTNNGTFSVSGSTVTPPNWTGVTAYARGVLPVDNNSSIFTGSANKFDSISINFTPRGSGNISYNINNIERLIGSNNSLSFIPGNLNFNFGGLYTKYIISFTPKLRVPNVQTKLLLPMDEYVPATQSTTAQGVDIGDPSINSGESYPRFQFRNVYAAQIHNAIWNDYVDKLTVQSDLILTPGKCYIKSGDLYDISTKYCQQGTLGIHSDTYAHSVGNIANVPQLSISVSGYVLAYTDKRYAPGTPLTSGKSGKLTKMHWWSRMLHPERLVGTYLKDEPNEYWNKVVLVNGRNWIKVK